MVYESIRTKMRYENDGSGVRETSARIRVQTDAGLALAGQLVFNYNSENEIVEIRSVRVLKPDGTSITTGPDNVQDLSAPVAQIAPVYSDARQKHVTVAGLAVGDTIEYDVVTSSKPLDPGQFWQTYSFETAAVTRDEELELNVPRNRPLKLKSPKGLLPQIREDGDRRIYLWKSSNDTALNPLVPPKNLKFDLKTVLEGYRPAPPPQVVFSTFESWGDVGNWYAGLEKARRKPTAEVRAQADKVVHGKTTDRERAEALYEWVGQNIRYVSLSFGVGRYQPHAAGEVLANRYGDCKDKTTLLEALLEAEGIRAGAALMNTQYDVDLDVPTPLAFNHAITFASIDGKDTWLDATVGIGAFGYLLPQLRGKSALVADAGSPAAIRTTPSDLPFVPMYRFVIDGKVDEGSYDILLKMQTRGDLEAIARLIFTRVSPPQFSSVVEQQMAKQSGSGNADFKLSSFNTSDPLDTTKPFEIEARINGKVKSSASVESLSSGNADGLATFVATLLSTSKALDFLLPASPSGDSTPDKSSPIPLTLGGPKDVSLEVNLTFSPPTAGKPAHPGSTSLQSDFADFGSNVTWDGQTTHGNWQMKVLANEVPPSEFKTYSGFREKVLETLDNSTAKTGEVTTADSDSPASSPHTSARAGSSTVAPDPRELFSMAEGEARRQNYANAMEEFELAVKTDPTYSDAWRELGRTYMFMRNYPKAEEAFRKYLALAPDDSRAYLNMAWVLYNERKFDEDVGMLKKRVETAPDDGDAHTRLGAAYLALHEPELAVAQLERAVDVFPKYQFAQNSLGIAYLQTHQDEKAVAAFQKAIDINPTSMAFNDAAYSLAENHSSLDVAEKWSAHAVSEVEVELNQTTFQTDPSRCASLSANLAMFWDTLGWIKYQKADYPAAESYITAAWELLDDPTVATHLGHIYAAQGKNADALEAYSAALQSKQAGAELSDDEKDSAKQFAALSIKDTVAPAATAAARARFQALHSIIIDNTAGLQGIAQYSIVIGPDAKVTDMQLIGQDSGLAAIAEKVRSTPMPQTFPDTTIQKLFRVGTLACASSNLPCTLTLLSSPVVIRQLLPVSSPASRLIFDSPPVLMPHDFARR